MKLWDNIRLFTRGNISKFDHFWVYYKGERTIFLRRPKTFGSPFSLNAWQLKHVSESLWLPNRQVSSKTRCSTPENSKYCNCWLLNWLVEKFLSIYIHIGAFRRFIWIFSCHSVKWQLKIIYTIFHMYFSYLTTSKVVSMRLNQILNSSIYLHYPNGKKFWVEFY